MLKKNSFIVLVLIKHIFHLTSILLLNVWSIVIVDIITVYEKDFKFLIVLLYSDKINKTYTIYFIKEKRFFSNVFVVHH